MSDNFNQEDWPYDLYREPVEIIILDREFPQEFEVDSLEAIPSEIDSGYYEVPWAVEHPDYPKVDEEGDFIAFIPKALHQEALASIGDAPQEFLNICAKITVEKRDQPDDKKSHPNWQCWLEVTETTFLRWNNSEVHGDNYEDDDDEVPVEISDELGDPNESISQKLENLLVAFEAKGADGIRESMQSGLSREEINKRTDWFPADLPEPIIELYEWANGQASDPWNEKYPFVFRDMGFLSLENAAAEYESMMTSYGVDNTLEDDRVELATSFPFAAFNGGWYVVPAGKHTFNIDNPQLVVCVLEGIEMQFHSVPKMLDTCTEWVRSNSYNYEDSELGDREEMAIWVKHNPGIDDDD